MRSINRVVYRRKGVYHSREFSWDYIDRVLIVLHDISINSADGRATLYGIYHKCISMHKRHILLNRRVVKKKHKFLASKKRLSNIAIMRNKMSRWYRWRRRTSYKRNRKKQNSKKQNSKKHNIEKQNSNKHSSNKHNSKKQNSKKQNSKKHNSSKHNSKKYKIGETWRYQNYFSGQNEYFAKRRPTYVPDLSSLFRKLQKDIPVKSTSDLNGTPVKRTFGSLLNVNGTDALAARGTFIHRKYRHVAYRHKRVKHIAGRAHTFTRIRKIRNISWTHVMKRSINRRLVVNCFMNSLVCHPEMFLCYDRYILIISLKQVRLHMCVDYHGIDFTNKMLQTDLTEYFNKINIHG